MLFQVTAVPAVTHKRELSLAFGMLGVEDAPLAVRFTSTAHGVEADPHVLLALHSCAGFGSEHAYLLLFVCAIAELARRRSNNASNVHLPVKHR